MRDDRTSDQQSKDMISQAVAILADKAISFLTKEAKSIRLVLPNDDDPANRSYPAMIKNPATKKITVRAVTAVLYPHSICESPPILLILPISALDCLSKPSSLSLLKPSFMMRVVIGAIIKELFSLSEKGWSLASRGPEALFDVVRDSHFLLKLNDPSLNKVKVGHAVIFSSRRYSMADGLIRKDLTHPSGLALDVHYTVVPFSMINAVDTQELLYSSPWSLSDQLIEKLEKSGSRHSISSDIKVDTAWLKSNVLKDFSLSFLRVEDVSSGITFPLPIPHGYYIRAWPLVSSILESWEILRPIGDGKLLIHIEADHLHLDASDHIQNVLRSHNRQGAISMAKDPKYSLIPHDKLSQGLRKSAEFLASLLNFNNFK